MHSSCPPAARIASSGVSALDSATLVVWAEGWCCGVVRDWNASNRASMVTRVNRTIYDYIVFACYYFLPYLCIYLALPELDWFLLFFLLPFFSLPGPLPYQTLSIQVIQAQKGKRRRARARARPPFSWGRCALRLDLDSTTRTTERYSTWYLTAK